MRSLANRLAIAGLPVALLGSSFTIASEVELPRTMAWTAYGTGTSGYAQAVAIGNMLQSNYGTSVRVLPGDNDVSRMTPLKQGRVELCLCGISSYFAFEGIMMFAGPDWGPQPLRVITTSIAPFGLSLAIAGDINAETPSDLRGKRVAYIRGDDALNKGTEAYLAFGGLTWDDVERVDYPGLGSSFQGIIAGNVDASYSTTVAPDAQRLASSPRGISWPILDPEDTEGWERMAAVAPYFQPHRVSLGAGDISEDSPIDSAGYPYPIVIGDANLDNDVAYGLIKALQDNYDDFKDNAPGAIGYAQEFQDLTWVIPLHDAVVDYYQEIGIWTSEMQSHQDELVARQDLLLTTWEAFVIDAPSDEQAFKDAWMEARTKALREAGFDPVFE